MPDSGVWVVFLVGAVFLLLGLGFNVKAKDIEFTNASPRRWAPPLLLVTGGLLVIFGFLGTFGLIPKGTSSGPDLTPSPTGSAESSPTSPQSPTPTDQTLRITFENPKEMSTIPLSGTTASGKIEGQVGDLTLWFSVLSPPDDNGGVHYVSDKLSTGRGRWGMHTGQLGSEDPSEAGQIYRLEILAANADASQQIQQRIDQNKINGKWEGWSRDQLPAGATVAAELLVQRG